MSEIPCEDLITNNTRNTRASNGYMVPRSRTNTHLYSFYPAAIRLWNRLPPNIQSSSSLNSFKEKISKINVDYDQKYHNQGHQPFLASLKNIRQHTSAK